MCVVAVRVVEDFKSEGGGSKNGNLREIGKDQIDKLYNF